MLYLKDEVLITLYLINKLSVKYGYKGWQKNISLGITVEVVSDDGKRLCL